MWLYGSRVAELTTRGRPGEVICRYTDDARHRWPANTPLLSCALPLVAKAAQAGVFFRGLLPEGHHRQALADQAGVATYDTFGLLARYGRDVAGALVIAAEDPADRPGEVEPYTAADLEAEVEDLPDRPLGIHDDSELSLAGIQDKLLLVDLGGGRWGRPVHGRPSTHILKAEDRRYPGMVEMEAACLSLARHAGLTTIDPVVETFAGNPCVIVNRFDRHLDSAGGLVRIHQEDACQALARDPDAAHGRGKYQRAGGPALAEIGALLDRFSLDAVSELTRLVRVVTFNVLIGNADAHGKNLALLHDPAGGVTLAPLYDLVPTVMWPRLRREAAMAVNGVEDIDAIRVADVAAEAGRWPLDRALAHDAAVAAADDTLAALASVAVPAELADSVAERAQAFLSR
ncbi:MAG: HipA domain-containing protein [Acidimicrobiia bacterium]